MILILQYIHVIPLIVTVCTYISPYCYSSASVSSVPYCLPSGNPDEQVNSLNYGPTLIDQITMAIYKYDNDI